VLLALKVSLACAFHSPDSPSGRSSTCRLAGGATDGLPFLVRRTRYTYCTVYAAGDALSLYQVYQLDVVMALCQRLVGTQAKPVSGLAWRDYRTAQCYDTFQRPTILHFTQLDIGGTGLLYNIPDQSTPYGKPIPPNAGAPV
jgi:hypothetical protein